MNTTTTTTTSYREKEAKQLAEYLLSREVVFRASSGLGVSVVVDGFRFAHEQSSHVHERFPNTDDTPPHMRRCTIFFLLSHFHSDHYTGITADWPHGSIYGSPTTMALVQKRLRLPATKVVVLEMGHVHHFNLHRGTYEGSHEEQSPQSLLPLPLDSATMEVRLLPANHCPGAVMFLISTHEDGHILHTGDFRCAKVGPQPDPYEEDIFAHPYLRCVRGEVARLFMDNTYCNPVYRFPSQPEAAEALEDHLRKLVQHVVAQGTRKKPRCLVLIGSYVIGKERLALGLQQRLPQGQSRKDRVPIYVSSSKMSLITTMDFFAHHFRALHSTTATKTEEEEAQDGDVHVRGVAPTGTEVRWMPPTERALNFEDAELKDEHGHEGGCCCDLTIILASMAAVGYTALSTTMGKSEAGGATPPLLDLGDGIGADLSCYDVVLAVEPTGWTKSVKAQPLSPSLHRLRVPYSEHSSFEELRGFVTELNPREIIPTVSLAQYNQQETQFAQVAPRLRCRGTAPLSRYFERRPAAPSAPATSKAPDEEPATTHKPGNPFHLSAEVEGAAALPRGEGGGEEASCHQQPSRKRAHVGAPTGLSRWMQRAAHIDVAEIDEDEEDVVITGASAPQIVEISDED